MKLSHVERVMLANQYKILSLLDEHNAAGYDLVREALENGYETYYSDAMSREVYEDELSSDESRLVVYAMDMYWAMQRSYERLEDKSGIQEERLDFPGFDGNDETKFASYSQFVVDKEKRFVDLRFDKDRNSGGLSGALLDRYNSHMPMVDIYAKRVAHWNPMEGRYSLSKGDILAILEIR